VYEGSGHSIEDPEGEGNSIFRAERSTIDQVRAHERVKGTPELRLTIGSELDAVILEDEAGFLHGIDAGCTPWT